MSSVLQHGHPTDGVAANRSDPPFAQRSLRAIGTTATVALSDPTLADLAAAELERRLGLLDAACSRFRPDSELQRLERTGGGKPAEVSALLYELLEVGCAVAALTGGTVDPTVGAGLAALGYDRDFEELTGEGDADSGASAPAPGWWRLSLDPTDRTVAIPEGVQIDLGASAKAFAADRAATSIAELAGCGVLVNLGGDVAVGGPVPENGWPVGIAFEHSAGPDQVDAVVHLFGGGLATSGTTVRSWRQDGRTVHHIVDPWTGEPAEPVWSMVSVLAPSCVEANAFSTAAVVWGDDAPGNLAAYGVRARLVGRDGGVTCVGDGAPAGPLWRERGPVR